MGASFLTHSGHVLSRLNYRFASLLIVAIGATMAPIPAMAANDPAGSGPVVAALKWLEDTLLGNVATSVSVIAVAFIGFLMLTGRMNWRFGATVIIGCFILFGATAIVAGIQTAVGGAN